jgi:hypothetical protein
MAAPAIGTYIRPVGAYGYAYCLQVESVKNWPGGPEQIMVRRFGMDRDHQPVVDGHQTTFHLNDLVEVLPGAWRESNRRDWGCGPVYWKRMAPAGQQDLFT